jgi:hypothetical protein
MYPNDLKHYFSIASFGRCYVVVRLLPHDKLVAVNLEARAMFHEMTVAEYVGKFTKAHERADGTTNPMVLVMSRQHYLSETQGANKYVH